MEKRIPNYKYDKIIGVKQLNSNHPDSFPVYYKKKDAFSDGWQFDFSQNQNEEKIDSDNIKDTEKKKDNFFAPFNDIYKNTLESALKQGQIQNYKTLPSI